VEVSVGGGTGRKCTAVSSTAALDQLGVRVLSGILLHSTSQQVVQDAVCAVDGRKHTRVAAIEQFEGRSAS
jgi:hypothetical protein